MTHKLHPTGSYSPEIPKRWDEALEAARGGDQNARYLSSKLGQALNGDDRKALEREVDRLLGEANAPPTGNTFVTARRSV